MSPRVKFGKFGLLSFVFSGQRRRPFRPKHRDAQKKEDIKPASLCEMVSDPLHFILEHLSAVLLVYSFT